MSAEPDKIFPALLKKGLKQIIGSLTRFLRAYTLKYISSVWKLARVVFIPADWLGYQQELSEKETSQ